jgi:hypothetical protein
MVASAQHCLVLDNMKGLKCQQIFLGIPFIFPVSPDIPKNVGAAKK